MLPNTIAHWARLGGDPLQLIEWGVHASMALYNGPFFEVYHKCDIPQVQTRKVLAETLLPLRFSGRATCYMVDACTSAHVDARI